MRTIVAALGLVTVVALATPRPAAADFSLSIGLPGFGLFIADPVPPPVVAYYPPAYGYRYAPRPVYVHRYRYRDRGRGWGHHRHGRGHHDCN